MAWVEQLYLHWFLIFTLVLARISALVMTAPVFGSADVPARVRAFLSLALALVVTPTQIGGSLDAPRNLIDYSLLIGGDLLIGLILGLGLMVLFSGIQVAGQVISQMSGMSLADVFNPGFNDDVPVFSQLLYYVTLAVFVIIGGHRKVLAALLASFAALPPGHAGIPSSIAETTVALLTESFTLGIRAAAPATVALLLATLVLGLISRTVPQLNVLSIGFGINCLITLGALAVSLGAIAWLFQNAIDPMLDTILEGIQSAPA